MERSGWAALPCSSFRVTPGKRVRYSSTFGVPDCEMSSPGTIWIADGRLERGNGDSGRRAGANTLSAGSRITSSLGRSSVRSCWASSLGYEPRTACCACDGLGHITATRAMASKIQPTLQPGDIRASFAKKRSVSTLLLVPVSLLPIVEKATPAREEPEGHDVLAVWL